MLNDNCVYRHRRLDTNEIFYVGIGNIKRPYIKSNRSKWWKRIINKTEYSVEILAKNLSKEEACELEIFLISLYGRQNIKTGILCNLTEGGETLKGYKHSEEARKNMSIAAKNKPKVTEETKLKGAISKGTKVIDTETGLIYYSINEAARVLNLSASHLSRFLRGLKIKKKYNIKYYYN